METETQTESASAAQIDSSISELREHPAYMDKMHPQHKEINGKITELYKEKHSSGQGGAESSEGMPMRSNEPPDLPTQAQAELDRLYELGVDVSGEDTDGVTPEKVEGLKHLRLIEENKFDELGASLSTAAFKVGFPAESVYALRGFLDKVAQPNDELTKDILRVIANHIYRNRTR